MRNLLVILFTLLSINVSLAQTGWGYVNYTSYKTHNGNGSTNQYSAFANTAAGFDVMFNTANSNTTITHTGETPIVNLYNGSLAVPHWGGDYFGFKFEFWFIPKVSGTYYFATNSDDASDIFIDGTAVATYYGGHGASGYQQGSKVMVAGQRYSVVYRGQEYGGGEAFYFRWYRPGVGWGYWTDEVTNINSEPTKKARIKFDFGSTLDKTKFSINSALNSSGWVDVTNQLDSTKIGNGYKANSTSGQVEWCVIYDYDATNQRYRVGIDKRQYTNTPSDSVTQLKLFDLWDGAVTFKSDDGTWAEYWINTPTQFNYAGSSFSSNLRAGNGFYGVSSDFTFTPLSQYKTQSVTMTTTNVLSTLYNSIVTVSDVYLAFKELANGGIFGNQTGNEFTYGIQYKNADINDDNVFDESDCFRLLQHLTGTRNIVDTFNLNKTLKLIPKLVYDSIGKSNWTTFASYLGSTYNFDINTSKAIDTLNISGTWKGDVNLSHSATPPSNNVTTNSVVRLVGNSISNTINASIITELSDKVYAYITLDPLQQEVVGTQFQLNYDNSLLKFESVQFKTKGNPTNYSANKNDYINLGSLISDGSSILDNTTEYKITFTPINKLDNILGLISIGATDAVNKAGAQLKVKVN